MALADRADAAKRAGDLDTARDRLKEAFTLERLAASKVNVEPSRSVLLRSAASLAVEAEMFREAEQVIAMGLAGDPPHEIAEELRDLLDEANFRRHLDLRGVHLRDDEVRLSIAGSEVGTGVARFEDFSRRMGDFARALTRTAERQMGQRFREFGEPNKTTKGEVEIFVGAPLQAASLAVTFRLARPKGQELLFPTVTPSSVARELVECLTLINSGEDKQLRERIRDDAYYNNFVSLSRAIAPDGQAVKVVGVTQIASGTTRLDLPFKRKAKTIRPYTQASTRAAPREEEIVGVLNFADDRKSKSGKIKIGGMTILVKKGMLGDIVKPLWGKKVRATCTIEGKEPTLVAVGELNESS